MTSYPKHVKDNTWIVQVQRHAGSEDLWLELPLDALSQLGWAEGDSVEWMENTDRSWSLTRKEKHEN